MTPTFIRGCCAATLIGTATLFGCGQTPTATDPGAGGAGAISFPTPSAAPTASPSATASGTCQRTSPAGNPVVGTSRQGDYVGQQLPDGYDQYGSEAEVTAAIQKLYNDQANWACFQKFYPGATTVFRRKGRL